MKQLLLFSKRLFLVTALLGLVLTCALHLYLRHDIKYFGVTAPESVKCKVVINSSRVDHTAVSQLTTPAGVPMILHFVYKNTMILEAYRSGIETCSRLNHNWTVMLWTDDSVSSFISREYPQYKSAFYGFPHKIQRADAIRYLILYTFGGVYLDLDMTCRQPLLASLSDAPCFLDREREHQTQVLHGRRYSAMNSAMGCVPTHPFFRTLIHSVFNQSSKREPFKFPHTIFSTTGPGILTRVYDQWRESNSQPPVVLLTESYFSPFVNPRSSVYWDCRRIAKSLGAKKAPLTMQESACLEVHKMGYELSDAKFVTNETVAIHQFTHLGYRDQFTSKFHALRQYPNMLTFTNICYSVTH